MTQQEWNIFFNETSQSIAALSFVILMIMSIILVTIVADRATNKFRTVQEKHMREMNIKLLNLSMKEYPNKKERHIELETTIDQALDDVQEMKPLQKNSLRKITLGLFSLSMTVIAYLFMMLHPAYPWWS